MYPDKDKPGKKQQSEKETIDAVETPSPPQHMDPSKKPVEEKNHQRKKRKK